MHTKELNTYKHTISNDAMINTCTYMNKTRTQHTTHTSFTLSLSHTHTHTRSQKKLITEPSDCLSDDEFQSDEEEEK